jgi:hypothetical protein
VDFKYVNATKWLARSLGDITQSISWSYYSSGSGYIVSPIIGVRSESVFAIFKQVSPLRLRADEKFQRTLSTDIWRLASDRSRGEFKVTSEEDAHRVVPAIMALIRSDAMPFFERCTSIADIDRLFNIDPNSTATRLLSLDNWTRSANALIAARLAHNPKYEGLVDVYRTLLAGFSGGQYLKQYESLVVLLSKIK